VLASVRVQVDAGAVLVFVCEPAVNTAFLSPNQVEGGSDVFERFVMIPNRRVAAYLAERGADLLLHDCGDLRPSFVRRLGELRPAILSLGSAVRLWEIAAEVPHDVVLFGNLPSKKFLADEEISESQVCDLTRDLAARMRACRHPFIAGTECDVLSVPGHEATIARKVMALLRA
jgi:uroporphyrinogen-III decarboxylase